VRLDVVPDNAREEQAASETIDLLWTMMETVHGPLLGRAVQAAIWLGVCEAMADGPLSAAAIAAKSTNGVRATTALLDVLATTMFLEKKDDLYELTPVGRDCMLGVRQGGSVSFQLMGVLEWRWYARFGEFLRAGRPLDMHEHFSRDEWFIYQESMYARAKESVPLYAPEVPIPKGPCRLLSVGGGHGYFACHLCHMYPELSAVVFDLPQALEASQQWFDRESRDLGTRVSRTAGNALTNDLGENEYDVVLISMVVHVLRPEENRELIARSARALRPGGLLIIIDGLTDPDPTAEGESGSFVNILLAFVCASAGWTIEQMEGWQRDAGLEKERTFEIFAGGGAVIGRKPR
jgi:SAM-dependent methyltransferase